MRKITEHIDQRNWRTIDYFRILENKKKLEAQDERIYNSAVRIFPIQQFFILYIRNLMQILKIIP
jgi:hypothetical protein